MSSRFRCIACGQRHPPGTRFRCDCSGLLEVEHELGPVDRELFDHRLGRTEVPYDSGVWRFKELVHPEIGETYIVSRPEGNTNLYARRQLAEYVGIKRLSLKHEGLVEPLFDGILVQR